MRSGISSQRISVPHVPVCNLSALLLACLRARRLAGTSLGALAVSLTSLTSLASLQRSSPPGWHAGAVSRQDETSVAQARHCSHETANDQSAASQPPERAPRYGQLILHASTRAHACIRERRRQRRSIDPSHPTASG